MAKSCNVAGGPCVVRDRAQAGPLSAKNPSAERGLGVDVLRVEAKDNEWWGVVEDGFANSTGNPISLPNQQGVHNATRHKPSKRISVDALEATNIPEGVVTAVTVGECRPYGIS